MQSEREEFIHRVLKMKEEEEKRMTDMEGGKLIQRRAVRLFVPEQTD